MENNLEPSKTSSYKNKATSPFILKLEEKLRLHLQLDLNIVSNHGLNLLLWGTCLALSGGKTTYDLWMHSKYFNILHISEAWITFIPVLWIPSNVELRGLSSTTFVSTLWPWIPSITHFWEKSCKVLRFAKYFSTFVVIFFNWVSNICSFLINKWREKFFYSCKQHFSKLYFLEMFYAKKWLVDFQGLTNTNFNMFIVIANG